MESSRRGFLKGLAGAGAAAAVPAASAANALTEAKLPAAKLVKVDGMRCTNRYTQFYLRCGHSVRYSHPESGAEILHTDTWTVGGLVPCEKCVQEDASV